MHFALREQLAAQLAATWDARAPVRTPDDVARHGATDIEEAVLAYGMLRLEGLAVGGGSSAAAADRVLRGDFEPPVRTLGGGPYRAPPALTAADVHGGISAAAAELAGGTPACSADEIISAMAVTHQAFAQARAERRRGVRSPGVFTVGIPLALAVTATCAALVLRYAPRCETPPAVTLAALATGDVHGAMVTVTCDRVVHAGRHADEKHQTLDEAYMCVQGHHTLAVIASAGTAELDPVIAGEVRSVGTDGWIGRVMAEDRGIPVLLDTEALTFARSCAATATGVGALALCFVAGILSWHGRRRRRR